MTYAAAVLSDAPNSYLPLDEAAGATSFANLAAPANFGVPNGAVAAGRAPVRRSSSACLDVGPSAGYLTWADATDMTGDWTVEYWAVWDSFSIFNPTVSKLLDAGDFAFLTFLERSEVLAAPPGQRYFTTQRKHVAYEGYYAEFLPSLTASDWHVGAVTWGVSHPSYHVVVVNESNTLTVYVNGLDVGAHVPPTWSAASANNTGTWRIGTTLDSFWGDADLGISDVAVYGHALSEARVVAHFAAA